MPQAEETTASTTKQSTFTVSEPFDSDSAADVVIISCDDSQFRARKAILSFVSPVFSDMFSLPQTKGDGAQDGTTNPDSLPVVHLSETGLVIDTLLRYCYPLASPVTDVDILIHVLEAADKYDMQYVILEVESDLNQRRFSPPGALLFLYRRACDQHRENDARRYALDCLNLPYPSIVKYWGANNSFGALSNLIDYHQAVSVAIGSYVTEFWQVGSKGNDMWGNCRKCKKKDHLSYSQGPAWWTDGLLSRMQNIWMEGPTSARLLPSERAVELVPCAACVWSVHGKWNNFETKFGLAIKEEAKRIAFVLPW